MELDNSGRVIGCHIMCPGSIPGKGMDVKCHVIGRKSVWRNVNK